MDDHLTDERGHKTAHAPMTTRSVRIPVGAGILHGDLAIPEGARALVLFAHGSGSGRHSPRNRAVAASLNSHALATLLMDLLTVPEEALDQRTGHLRFDIGLLASRLVAAMDWAGAEPATRAMGIGLFGASTGAAAALVAAAERPRWVGAVVSRGGRPDLAGGALSLVKASTLLIVGGNDEQVIALNRDAVQLMTCHVRLEIVPDAGHLFEEPGAIEEVARLAGEWFTQYLHPS